MWTTIRALLRPIHDSHARWLRTNVIPYLSRLPGIYDCFIAASFVEIINIFTRNFWPNHMLIKFVFLLLAPPPPPPPPPPQIVRANIGDQKKNNVRRNATTTHTFRPYGYASGDSMINRIAANPKTYMLRPCDNSA